MVEWDMQCVECRKRFEFCGTNWNNKPNSIYPNHNQLWHGLCDGQRSCYPNISVVMVGAPHINDCMERNV